MNLLLNKKLLCPFCKVLLANGIHEAYFILWQIVDACFIELVMSFFCVFRSSICCNKCGYL